MCEKRAEIRDSLRDLSVVLRVSQPKVLAWSNNSTHQSSEKARVWDQESALKSGGVKASLLVKDLEKKWRANWERLRSNIQEIPNIQQVRKWRSIPQTVSIASLKDPEVFYLREAEGLMGGSSFGSKSPRVEFNIEERNELFEKAIRLIEEGVELSDNFRIYSGVEILTYLSLIHI